MQGLWEKAKKTMVLGVSEALDVTGVKKVEDDPEYMAKLQTLSSIENHCISIEKAVAVLANDIHKFSISSRIVANSFADVFKADEKPFFELSKGANECSESTLKACDMLSTECLPKQVVAPIIALRNEINSLKVLSEKRKKNLILLQEIEKDIEKKRGNGPSKTLSDLTEQGNRRRSKYSRYNDQFMNGVAQLESKSKLVFGKCFNAYQFYLSEFVEESKKMISEHIPSFPYDQLRTELPPLTPPAQGTVAPK